MPADDKIMEALARIEHKVDLCLEMAAKKAGFTNSSQLPKVGDQNHSCILCSQPIRYDVDINDAVVVRKCGCGTGKIALDLKNFAPPALPDKKKEEDNGGSSEEDRNDSSTRRRHPGRR